MKRAIGIRTSVIASSLIILAIACDGNSKKQVELEEKTETIAKEPQWTQDQEDVKATVEHFLVVGGNYDLDAMDEMILDKANIGISRLDEGEWQNSTKTIAEYFEKAKQNTLKPYYEPVRAWDIKINKGQLAFAKADAILHSFGIPRRNNVDYFTLIKEKDSWRFLNLSFTSTSLPEDEKIFNLESFARSYAQVWSGVRPEFVALFFEENGALQVNENKPALGREQIAKIAKGFMLDLPDMVVSFDSLVNKTNGTEFHWTLTATNSGPGGTGKKVKVSGFELWQLGENGRILNSQGHFPTEEYNRQLGIED
ncbi:ester cyclase [uncultured Algibacter sp.]|uniref:ester cyclase n=1 Tax=uncultured Algibacter sp. TaxID=298659 RepID=UPI0030EEF64F|tara:strand:+ start:22 stop:954 length:933 start_codon:yes stop_codon:yes gene_type:complete